MKRIVILFIMTVFVGAGTAWAGKAAYKLVMSKDKELCAGIVKLFNEDLKKYGTIRYEDHEMFTAIKWEPMDCRGKKFDSDLCNRIKVASFDVDNGGSNKKIVKTSTFLRSQLSDDLFIFDGSYDISQINEFADLLKTPDKIDLTGDTYTLREIKHPTAVGGILLLNPFKFSKIFYISMTDLKGEWLLITKYKGGTVLDDMCYLQKIGR